MDNKIGSVQGCLKNWISCFFIAFGALQSVSSVYAGDADLLEKMKARVPQIVQAKDAGKIGERPDGLLGFVKSDADAATKKLVEEENADRQAIYSSRSSEQGQSLDVFMRVMGDSRIDQEKMGRFIQKSDGTWQKKK